MTMMVEIFGYRQLRIKARMLKNHTEACTHGVRVLHQALAKNLRLATGCG
jgi:hypothetical protein